MNSIRERERLDSAHAVARDGSFFSIFLPSRKSRSTTSACAQWVVVREVKNNAHRQRGFRWVQLPCFVTSLGLRWH